MNKRLQSYMTQIFLVWLTLFAVLAFVTVQSMEWEHVKPVPAPPVPVVVNDPPAVPQPAPEPEPEPEYRLLAVGRAQGKGTLGKPVIAQDPETKEIHVTIPYTGTLGEYTSFPFNGPTHGECFDLHGVWQGQTGSYHSADRHSPVRVVQVGQHGNFMRFSLIGASGSREARWTDNEIILVLKDPKRVHTQAPARTAHKAAQEQAPAQAGAEGARGSAAQSAQPAAPAASPGSPASSGAASPAPQGSSSGAGEASAAPAAAPAAN